jgi:outer membrane protein assembly factor BamB
MAYLEIAHLTGDVDKRELSKQQPVSIGSHKSNDVCIDEAGVEIMHCRISWNKTGFEAVAAGIEGLDVNGSFVQRALLKPGDVLRFGSVDIRFKTEDAAAAPATTGDPGTFGLKPLSEELPLPSFLDDARTERVPPPRKAATPVAPSSAAAVKPPRDREPEPEPLDDVLDDREEQEATRPGDDGFSALAAESRVDVPARREMPRREEEPREGPDATAEDDAEKGAEPAAAPLTRRLREAMHGEHRRPGEEDTIRSPLVLILGGGAAILLLVGATFYFLAGRQTTRAQFDQAMQLLNEQKFTPAIAQFAEFIALHPKDPLTEEAQLNHDLALIDQQIRTATPNWNKGLDALRGFVGAWRDRDNFSERHEAVRVRAGDIALGAAQAAGKVFDRELLQTSGEAKTVFTTYLPKDGETPELLREIEQTVVRSEAAILRHETFQQALSALDQQLQARQPLQALVTRRDLLVRYPEFAKDKKLADKLTQTLESERALVQKEDPGKPAAREDHPAELPAPATLVFHARSRTDQVSVGQAVCALSKDCCYGVDTVTGQPLWRRVVGLDTPFFPLRDPSLPSAVLFDTRHNELVRVHQNTGQLLWRQPLDAPASGTPLIDEGQIYVPTRGGHLYKIDLESGAVTTRLTFSQAITNPVVLADGTHLLVGGDREVVYTLTKRPLECVRVSYLGQKPQSTATLLTVGPYVLLPENGDGEHCTLRLLDCTAPDKDVREVAAAPVEGRVLDTPVIRGRDLFVPSTRERVSAFAISDDAGQPPLTVGPAYQVKGEGISPIFLATGPDRQLWMASSALRKLQLTATALDPDQKEVAVGLSSQPLQYVGGTMFNARRRPFTDAVTFTQTDRDELVSEWQAVLGGRLIACSPADAGGAAIVCATEAGSVFRVTDKQWQAGGFLEQASTRLPLNEELKDPLLAIPLTGGQAAVVAGDPEPRLWVINRLGQVERALALEAAPQAPPALLGQRLLLPVKGKLQVARSAGAPPVQDFALPTGEADTARWRQLIGIDENSAVALTESGSAILVRIQTTPRTHVAQVSRIDLGAAVDVRGDVAGGLVALATADQQVRLFQASNLEPRAERRMDAPISNDVWLAGACLFVETAGQTLHCLDPAQGLAPRWTLPLDGRGLADSPLVAGSVALIGRKDGLVAAVDLGTGQVRKQVAVGSPLSSGPFQAGADVLVATLDGSLVNVTSVSAP